MRQRFKLSTIIIFFVCMVVLASLLITNLLITNSTSEDIENQLEEKAIIVSRTVAESQVVQNGLQRDTEKRSTQEYAMTIQEAAEVLFVVVIDMEGIRHSHPNPERIGNHFVGGDEERVLQGEEYTSRATGTLGKSLRAFTPVYAENGNQIGAVSVGISLEDVQASIRESQKQILIGSALGLLIGIVGAFGLARYIKKSLFGLEPYAIARIHEERNQMLHSVYEGIIAIDKDEKIVLVNKSARQIFHKAGLMDQDPVGMNVHDFLPETMLDHVGDSQHASLDEELNFNGVSVISNRVPLVVNNRVVGAIATFRDKTEVNKLAEQLTGVQMYADTLRAQSHEFMNQLHVLLGMIKMEEYNQVKKFIAKLVDHQAHEVGNITRHIKDPAFAGFIIGKASYAREAHVDLTVICETEIPEPENPAITHELITILGNVLDNALDSVTESDQKSVTVLFSYIDELLTMTVTDTGVGIPEDKQEKIFNKGVSSKEDHDHGYGLYLAKISVEKLEGSIEVESDIDSGTAFTIIIPYQPGGAEDD